MSSSTATISSPPACCGRKDGQGCVCRNEATCSCGKKSAGACDCEKSSQENAVKGATCSCGARAAGSCTCSRAKEENQVSGEKCSCGLRSKGACTCGGHLAPAGAPEKSNDNEIDFTSKK